jgi:hypothetical protein
MSQKFIEKFAEMVFEAIMILLGHQATNNVVFLNAYIVALGCCFVYGLYFGKRYLDLKENLYLFFPLASEKAIDPLAIPEDKALARAPYIDMPINFSHIYIASY